MTLSLDPKIIYPDSDGQPMADNTKQFRWIVLLKENLDCLFAQNPHRSHSLAKGAAKVQKSRD